MGRRRTVVATLVTGTAMTATVLLHGPAAGAVAGYPYCAAGAASDPDGDGWGWENEASCVVRGGPADTGPADGAGARACPPGAACGSYAVGGLGGRKQQILAAGGNDLDLAVGMLETEHLQSDYPYGDGKTADAANFGIFRQNWLMIRSACDRFAGEGPDRYGDGAVLDGDLGQDLACLHQSQGHYGVETWFAGHRNGATGLGTPGTADIAAYRAAVYWIRDQIAADPAHRTDDTRFWVDVPAK